MTNRCGLVYYQKELCGKISETDEGYSFEYDSAWLKNPDACEISHTLPLSDEPYLSKTLFSFFDGLIPEGWLLEVAVKNWKLNPRDRMGLLLATCQDCIGAVSVKGLVTENKE
ncbi:MAG TPA: phosphatidylinositol kinase [Treponema sp.]|nr:phosphatidylinositol kinase [Treponema sp.]